MQIDTANEIAVQLRLRPQQVRGAIEAMGEGDSLAFIAHYRKEQTGGLPEETLQRILECLDELSELEHRKEAVRRSIEELGLLTPDLQAGIEAATHLRVVEDLYLAFRPLRNTAAAKATERGLKPLAEAILEGGAASLEDLAANYVHHERDVHTTEDALAGAAYIIAEGYSVNPRVRQRARDVLWSQGVLRCARGSVPDSQVKELRDYFNFSEPVKNLPPHRILAVNRGERKKALRVAIEVPQDILVAQCREGLIPPDHAFREFLERCLTDCLERLVVPAISREARQELTERSEQHAVDVFANNVRGILMTPPVGPTRVLAIDPGFRTGCKAAAIDAQGALLGETIVYPHEPQARWDEAKTSLLAVIRKYEIQVIAIGNGTGCHETEKLVSEIIAENDLDVQYALVSEAGASAYAAGTLAGEEFPNLDPALRATVSIGRRLQNPLSEFVKVDPRVIGVGLYQHDINQRRLKEHLDAVVRCCVNCVGVDVNTANVAVLENVAGLNAAVARNIIGFREQNGPLASREDLKKVPGIDEQVFRQCAGFLRIFGGTNPLDRTRIHPEQYAVAQVLIEMFGCTPNDLERPDGLPGLRAKLEGLSLEKLSKRLEVGIPTLSDILLSLEHPDYDPRAENPPPLFKRQMMRLEDLRPGMWLKGSVRNVVDFGAFVDVGVNEDGLVHVSQFSRKYIKNPVDFLHVGQTIDVRVIAIDKDRRRIALSMIPEDTPAEASASSAAPSPATRGQNSTGAD